ncbi:hypothetical protein CVT24_000224 [Panaeolus cyanescens]|uniref:Uncharacterized protein n=1 Tax=Panaeolus cyanescens TaxID=181874 RepID=A0A409VIQ5_9AGAR|nr:hypothetical protein CVT24_000224 [Panaeolus cyanescens]
MDSCLNTLIDAGDAEPSCRRSLWKVIWSCLVTLFACAWLAVHPNVAQDRETPWVVVWRRAGLMFSMIIVPEMVVCWALRQFVLASYIATKHKGEDHLLGIITFLILFGTGDGWTRTHGFFVIMGGFCYYSDKTGARETLTYARMLNLKKQDKIEWPNGSIVTSKVIEDRSKADWLAKSIVLIQTFWFCIQLFTRLGQHLVVTELEISTLAFAALNFIVYLLWWNKPFDVRSQILVRGTNDPERFDPQAPATPYSLQEYSAWSYLSDKWNRFKQTCITANENNIGAVAFIPAIFYGLFIAPFSTLFVEYGVSPGPSALISRKRAYQEEPFDNIGHGWFMRQLFNSSAQWVLVSGVAIIFGGIHLIAWPFHFPSGAEKWLWRGSAIALVCPAISLVIYLAVEGGKIPLPHRVHSILLGLLVVLMFLMAIAYVCARFIILCLPFIELRKLAAGALTETNWAALIPHF